MEENNGIVTRMNEFTNLLSQMYDPDALKAAGCINDEDYIDMKAKKMAYTTALDSLASGDDTYVERNAFEVLLTQMREVASAPTQEEINKDDIAYALMLLGEE